MAILAHAHNSKRHCSLEDSLLEWPGLPCACFTVDFFLFSILFHHFFHTFWSFMNILYPILYVVSASGHYNLQQLVISSRKSFNPRLFFLRQRSLPNEYFSLQIYRNRVPSVYHQNFADKMQFIKYLSALFCFVFLFLSHSL